MNTSHGLILLGAFILALGLILTYAPWLLSWFGKLPGDIRIENTHSFIFIPISSMIIVSLLVTCLLNLLFRK
jgi:hypothetical protein